MEGWFPRSCGEHTRQRIAMRWDCPRTESLDRAARNGAAAARAEPRSRSLNSRPPSQNGSRRPDRRICGESGSASCAPPLWKEIEAAFWAGADNSSFGQVASTAAGEPARPRPAGGWRPSMSRSSWLDGRPTTSSESAAAWRRGSWGWMERRPFRACAPSRRSSCSTEASWPLPRACWRAASGDFASPYQRCSAPHSCSSPAWSGPWVGAATTVETAGVEDDDGTMTVYTTAWRLPPEGQSQWSRRRAGDADELDVEAARSCRGR
jgi:hypothetical protein